MNKLKDGYRGVRQDWRGYLGLGALLALVLGGLASSALYACCHGENGDGVLLCRATFVVGMCAACPALRLGCTQDRGMPWGALCAASEVILAAGFAAGWAGISFGMGQWIAWLSCLACGAAEMCLLARWFGWLMRVCSEQGEGPCIAALAKSCLCAVATALPATLGLVLGAGSTAALGGCLIPIAVEALARSRAPLPGETGTVGRIGGGQTGRPTEGRTSATRNARLGDMTSAQAGIARYRLTPYALALLASFGATWGISLFYIAEGLCRHASAPLFYLPAICLACLTAIALPHAAPPRPQVPFGLLIRMSIALSGTLLASLPLLDALSPTALPVMATVVCATQSLSMTLFAVESCRGTGLDVCDVLVTNFMVFGAAGCASMLVSYVLQESLTPALAPAATTFLATVATVLVIPMLPSRNSTATAFTLDELPESKDFAQRADDARHNLVARHGLTARESDVLGLILQGMTRQEIADELSLSAWTVRDYTGGIYKKCGVHSAKELMARVGRES